MTGTSGTSGTSGTTGTRWCIGAAIACGLLGAAPAAQSQWQRVDSPNFVVMGAVGARDLRDVAVRFEGFRETLGRILSERVTSTAVPTVVIVFPHDRAFTPFRPFFQGKRIELAGLFVPRRDVNYIAMVKDADDERLRVLFHEYAHLVISNTGQRVPVWLNEGLAEYYSSFELERGGRSAVIGRVIPNHIFELNERKHLPLAELLNVTHQSPLYNEGSRRSVFYAQSWALTHLILQSQPSRAPQLATYLNMLARAATPEAAWQQAFGTQNLEQELDRYIRRQSYTATEYRFSDKIAGFEAQASTVAPATVEAFLSDFLAQTSQLDDAGTRIAAAAKLDPANPAVAIMTARISLAKREPADGVQRLRNLKTVDDWFLNYLAGVVVATSLEGRTPAPSDIELARRFFGQARVDRAESPNAIVRMATLDLRTAEGPTAETKAALERARAAAPGRHEYAFLLAQVLARMSEFQAARDLLGPMMTAAVAPEVRESARSLMGNIAAAENSRILRTEAQSARTSATTPASSTTTTAGPPPTGVTTVTESNTAQPAGVQPVYREIKPGEERFEGILERIDCVVNVGVTFRVKSGEGLVSVTSPDLTSVEFLTYRNDLKGSVTCGPVTPALPVYVTWRKGPAAGSRIAVAIEFLAKR